MPKTSTLLFATLIISSLFFIIGLLPYLGTSDPSLLIKPGDVKISTLYYKNQPYTLNFSQQNALLKIINECKKTTKLPAPPQSTVGGVQRIEILPFNKPVITFFPILAHNRHIFFSVKGLANTYYLDSDQSQQILTLFQESHALPLNH